MSYDADSSESFIDVSDFGFSEGLKFAKVSLKLGRFLYTSWVKWNDEHIKQLIDNVSTLLASKDYEAALASLSQLLQKAPKDRALWLYFSADCYRKLRRREDALRACEEALQSPLDEGLSQQIYALKYKILFGLSFWFQWALSTVVAGAVSFFGVVILLGDRPGDTSALLAFLSTGIAIGLAQWFLRCLRVTSSIWSLISNTVVVFVAASIAILLSSINNWLSLLVYIGITVFSTALFNNRSVRNPL